MSCPLHAEFCPFNCSQPPPKKIIDICTQKAEKFDPCLCTCTSTTGVNMDVYIVNTSLINFELVRVVIVRGKWIVRPPPLIKGKETIFIRGWTEICPNTLIVTPTIHFEIQLMYREIDPCNSDHPKTFQCVLSRTGTVTEDGQILFSPLNVIDFDTSTTSLQLYQLDPPDASVEWRNTVEFILAPIQKSVCK